MSPNTPQRATEMLRDQHGRVMALFSEVTRADDSERAERFDLLLAVLAVHETTEEVVVHPVARRLSEAGDRIVDARLDEERAAARTIRELEAMTPEDHRFTVELAAFRQDMVLHADAEERGLFPLLELRCDPAELDQMAEKIALVDTLAPDRSATPILGGSYRARVDEVRGKLAG